MIYEPYWSDHGTRLTWWVLWFVTCDLWPSLSWILQWHMYTKCPITKSMKNYQPFTFWWFKSLYLALTNMNIAISLHSPKESPHSTRLRHSGWGRTKDSASHSYAGRKETCLFIFLLLHLTHSNLARLWLLECLIFIVHPVNYGGFFDCGLSRPCLNSPWSLIIGKLVTYLTICLWWCNTFVSEYNIRLTWSITVNQVAYFCANDLCDRMTYLQPYDLFPLLIGW